MKRTKQLIMSFVAIAILGVGASARAQDSTTPPPSEPPPAAHSSSSNSISLGGGAGIGIGAAVTLSGLGAFGPAGQFVYDASIFHIEALLGFDSRDTAGGGGDRETIYAFGVGGWYHLHRGASSDFSVGGLIGINTTSGPGQSQTVTSFEPGAQVRAFVTPNVAAFARVGLAFQFGDTGAGTVVGLGGQATGGFGFSYFFR